MTTIAQRGHFPEDNALIIDLDGDYQGHTYDCPEIQHLDEAVIVLDTHIEDPLELVNCYTGIDGIATLHHCLK